jgi:hypothetical protein
MLSKRVSPLIVLSLNHPKPTKGLHALTISQPNTSLSHTNHSLSQREWLSGWGELTQGLGSVYDVLKTSNTTRGMGWIYTHTPKTSCWSPKTSHL